MVIDRYLKRHFGILSTLYGYSQVYDREKEKNVSILSEAKKLWVKNPSTFECNSKRFSSIILVVPISMHTDTGGFINSRTGAVSHPNWCHYNCRVFLLRGLFASIINAYIWNVCAALLISTSRLFTKFFWLFIWRRIQCINLILMQLIFDEAISGKFSYIHFFKFKLSHFITAGSRNSIDAAAANWILKRIKPQNMSVAIEMALELRRWLLLMLRSMPFHWNIIEWIERVECMRRWWVENALNHKCAMTTKKRNVDRNGWQQRNFVLG